MILPEFGTTEFKLLDDESMVRNGLDLLEVVVAVFLLYNMIVMQQYDETAIFGPACTNTSA